MQLAETVTFGGGGLNRAAELRSQSEELEKAYFSSKACILPVWRGKPLFCESCADETGPLEIVDLQANHPLLSGASFERLFLGEAEGRQYFAVDFSGWQPPEEDLEGVNGFFDNSQQAHPDAPEGARFHELRQVMARLSPLDAELAATAKSMLSWHSSHKFCARCGEKNEIAQAGWQRNCPACAAAHFPRTDPVVIMLITQGNDLLLGRSPGWPEGMFSLLAGFLEPGETMEAAVRREVAEETGVQVGAVEYLASQPWPYPSSLMMGCWGQAQSREITLDPNELEEAFWISREELAEAFAGTHPFLKPARKGSIAQFLMENWLADKLD